MNQQQASASPAPLGSEHLLGMLREPWLIRTPIYQLEGNPESDICVIQLHVDTTSCHVVAVCREDYTGKSNIYVTSVSIV